MTNAFSVRFRYRTQACSGECDRRISNDISLIAINYAWSYKTTNVSTNMRSKEKRIEHGECEQRVWILYAFFLYSFCLWLDNVVDFSSQNIQRFYWNCVHNSIRIRLDENLFESYCVIQNKHWNETTEMTMDMKFFLWIKLIFLDGKIKSFF